MLDDVMRATILGIGRAAIAAVDPGSAVRSVVETTGDGFRIGETRFTDGDFDRVIVLGAGKASPCMAAALEEILGDRIDSGVVVTKDGYKIATDCIEILEAGHPVPDSRGHEAARRILGVASEASSRDLLLCVMSGGGSALTPAPPVDISLNDLQDLTDHLLRSGATIDQMNVVRKHLSDFHGGRLAVASAPARVVGLLVSDVVGNSIDVIASGPFTPDPTTFGDALGVLDELDSDRRTAAAIRRHLERGVRDEIPDTPKPDDSIFSRVANLVVADNARAGCAAAEAARSAGFHAQFITSRVQGEAREIAKVVAGTAIDIAQSGRPLPTPGCAIFGGETTVTVTGNGRGGRSQELAVAAAQLLAGVPRVAVLAMATDGTDGPTDACGGLVDGSTIDRARVRGGDVVRALKANDTYAYLEMSEDLIIVGPTGTNVNDLYMAFAW